jgi:hypothetical protein
VDVKEDLVVMKNGKMMVRRSGKMKPMDLVMTLSNGTKVAMDGTITNKDGTSRILMDGEAITMDGEMTTIEDIEDKMEENTED